jgi:hypothetical protein
MLEQVLILFFAAFLQGALSYFINYTFYEGSIFGAWLPFLARMIAKHRVKKGTLSASEFKAVNGMITNARESSMIALVDRAFFYKILGGCPICSNVWQGILTFWIWYFWLGLSLGFYLPYVILGNFCLRKMDKEL